MAKRTFDVLLSIAGLVLLSPLLLAIAIWVRLDSPGPVFFRQERIGRGGIPFRMHKFRTMRDDPQGRETPPITVGDDPRITHAGAFLRRTKLDELPQLIDVLRGRMSLVGPRPEVALYVALYPAALREVVLSVRPGMTDLASIEFSDEAALLARASDPEREYVEVVMPRKLTLAARYVETRSLRLDLSILGRTVRVLLGAGPGFPPARE